jgi:peptide deformylase
MNSQDDKPLIVTYPNTVLRATARTVENIDGKLLKLADHMLDVMYSAPGIGLAANQVGELERLIVFDRQPGKEERDPCVLINPEIVLSEGETKYEEACLSVIDFSAEVTRDAQVKVRGVDRNGKPLDIEADGLLAICLQHEIDHLNGVLYIDHISSLKRALYKKKLKKKLKQGK